ncbi:MAG: hypothetical protein IBX50_18580 [Marinospirillum sp.]|uniref:hypothetical protein n=1 Tax=Marinospirillum sp. TaxID=2183934 RepID=UPI0019F7460D|nr:hypothetical protein [Marinospirillum sp.]MBE0508694.1 hypothetical protein [Marinospirillum sp.]
MEIIINPFGDPSLHEVEREKAEVDSLHSKIESYPGGDIPVEVTTKNIGKGADWLVVSVIILSSATSLFFAIPAAHKKVRETLEEWDRIFKEFKSLLDWLSIKKPVMMPDQYLFLVALSRLDEELDASELVYLGANIIPTDNPSHQGLEDMVFNFHNENLVESVAVSRSGNILWHHSVQLPDDA